jgi:hypothetical protein
MRLWTDRPEPESPNKHQRVEVDKDGLDEGYDTENKGGVDKSYIAHGRDLTAERGLRTMAWVMSN